MRTTLAFLALSPCLVTGCDDPPPGPTGALLLVVDVDPAPAESRFAAVASIRFDYDRLVARYEEPSGGEREVVLDAAARSFTLRNVDEEVVVNRLPAPAGRIAQLRFFAARVVIRTSDGIESELGPDGPELPSWRNTGWKWVADDERRKVALRSSSSST